MAMAWLGARRGSLVDWLTQRWVQLFGRRVAKTHVPWLLGPIGDTTGIGDGFFSRWADGQGMHRIQEQGQGLLPQGLAALDGPLFSAASIHPGVDEFYRHTANFEVKIQSRWRGGFRAFGWLISAVFARRLAQLNLTLVDDSYRAGVESRVEHYVDAQGALGLVAWVRTSRVSGRPIFVGKYGVATIPGHDGPCIQVVFPLPNGNAVILLRPQLAADGGLCLVSDGRRFGDPGFYFTVARDAQTMWVKYVRTMKERLTISGAAPGLCALHEFSVFGLTFLELRYLITIRKG